jgi:hypothetical protein
MATEAFVRSSKDRDGLTTYGSYYILQDLQRQKMALCSYDVRPKGAAIGCTPQSGSRGCRHMKLLFIPAGLFASQFNASFSIHGSRLSIFTRYESDNQIKVPLQNWSVPTDASFMQHL